MSDTELIAYQARKIASLQFDLTQAKLSCNNINNILYCIGGPLNDNVLGYTFEQLKPFFRIHEQVREVV